MEITLEYIAQLLAGHEPDTEDWAEGLRPASVLALFYPRPDQGLSLIFTKRTDHLDQHGGQISFPGGMRDPVDESAAATALREAREEIGVAPEDVRILGRLNQEATITGFSVAPFVGMIPYPYEFVLNHEEVDRLIVPPLAHLMDSAHFSWEYYQLNGNKYKTYKYAYESDVIWGATARMVFNLLHLLSTGREPAPDRPPFLKFGLR